MKDFFVEDILEKFEDYTQPVDQGPSFMNQEPRNMAQGGRIGFGDGGVTLITQGKNKGKYHLRLGSGENRKTHIGTKDNLDLIFKNRKNTE